MNKNKIYILEFRAENCEVLGLNNGFPVLDYATEFKSVEAPPINPFLSKDNNFNFAIMPLGVTDPSDMLNIPEFNFSIKLKEFDDGDTYTAETGEILFSINKDDIELDSLPIIIEKQQNISGIELANTYLDAPIIDNEEEIIEYALYLRDLFAKQNSEQIVKEFKTKLIDYSIAYYERASDFQREQKLFLDELFFPAKVRTNFDLTDLILTPYCDGKVWKVSQKTKDYFIYTEDLEDGSCYGINIYISKLGGKLRVVR